MINKGQSLFEVIFALGIVAVILVAIASLAAKSIANSTFSRNNALATKFTQEGIEWLREQRDSLDWTMGFYPQANGSTKNFGSLNWPPGGSCNIPQNTDLCRQVILASAGPEEVNVTVIVTWNDGQGAHSARSTTKLTNWNK
ncbi:MAG: hypothetical protein AAB649_01575 [Patescibacteria group bacterium]